MPCTLEGEVKTGLDSEMEMSTRVFGAQRRQSSIERQVELLQRRRIEIREKTIIDRADL